MPGVLTVREEGEARRHVFEQQAVVGRDSDCDVPLASRSVSRRHAILEKTEKGWSLRDIGSANGTFLAGARVTVVPLTNGAALRFGEVEALFEVVVKETSSAERLISSLSIPPVRKARPVAVFIVTTVGVLALAAATIWARYCDRAPTKAGARAGAAAVAGS
ncbi:MAG: FHA domain-containing protein [Thermoanaerobaculia bacterium]|nr:FHA domain-containing protein [Thermoanaerobaculia bacterium]